MKAALVTMALVMCAGCSGDDVAQPFDYDAAVMARSEWGWTDADMAASKHDISRITIHHGGVEFADGRDPVEYLRALQKWSREEKGWPDIPYHFVIDLDGNIYEGRPLAIAGDTNTSYDPSGHALIVIVGNYDNRTPSEPQLEAVAALAAHLASAHAVAVQDIKGHKDYAPGETSCPGANLYRYLEDGSLLQRIEDILDDRN